MDIYEQMLIETIEGLDNIIRHKKILKDHYQEDNSEKFIAARDRRKKELALLRRRRTIQSKRAAQVEAIP